MRTMAIGAITALVLCLEALTLAQTTRPVSFALSNVDDTKPGVVSRPCVLVNDNAVLQASPRTRLVPDLVPGRHRRSLKAAAKVKTRKATKWAAGEPTFLVTVITVSIFVALVLLFVAYLLITQKKKQDPKWRVRDLFQRRLKPGVKRMLTRRATSKSTAMAGAAGEETTAEEVEKTPKVEEPGAPPKV